MNPLTKRMVRLRLHTRQPAGKLLKVEIKNFSNGTSECWFVQYGTYRANRNRGEPERDYLDRVGADLARMFPDRKTHADLYAWLKSISPLTVPPSQKGPLQ